MGIALEWVELVARWTHVIAGVAWIGTSFYFNWLNDRLAPPGRGEPGLVGELWSVHGGGFYRAMKYDTVPGATLPELHWFKWEAYLTWISGASLLVLVYYLGAGTYMVDPGAARIAPLAAVGIGVGTLAAGWLVYDRLCRTRLAARGVAFTTLGLLLVTAVSYGLLQVLGSRAAYLHVGAMLGTIMAANVFFVIIPAHVELVRAVEAGRAPDPAIGAHAALRSRHNSYFTLPVLFTMVSNHYPFTYGHPLAWAILAGLFVIGALTRHGFNVRNQGRRTGWIFPAAALGLVALALAGEGTRRGGAGADVAGGEPPGYDAVREILVARCVTCHAEEPAHRLFDAPPGGVRLETAEQAVAWAERIQAVAVDTKIMPLGNSTGMTDEERATLARWIEAGAPLDR